MNNMLKIQKPYTTSIEKRLICSYMLSRASNISGDEKKFVIFHCVKPYPCELYLCSLWKCFFVILSGIDLREKNEIGKTRSSWWTCL